METLQHAHDAGNALATRRAMEKQMQRPQMMSDGNQLPDPKKGGGEMGLKRVVGAGRRGRRKAVVEAEVKEEMKGCSDGEMVKGGAKHQGKMLGEHLVKLHGQGFFDDFAKGFMSVIKPIASVVGAIAPGPIGSVAKMISGGAGVGKYNPDPQGIEVAHARIDSQLNPGAIAPVAYGNAPQAPASFKRNTVGMGKLSITHGGAKGRKSAPVVNVVDVDVSEEEMMPPARKQKKAVSAGDKRKVRGALISKLMKSKGMTLAQASKYIKENGLI